MEPAAGWVTPARALVSVVLPAPLRPTRPTRSPGATRKVAASRSRREPARSSTAAAVITRWPLGVGVNAHVKGCTRGHDDGLSAPSLGAAALHAVHAPAPG